ncbi:MAG: bifunctional 4-hydroxy-2-oxoglutarate aldolase/2-dehydro-3-deoxy-phosphogluconate aldolase [Tenacibaculum sp.]
MARFSRIEVVIAMKETGLIPLFYHPSVEVCKKVLKYCYNGGARLLEYTSRGDFAFEIFSELSKYAKKELPEMILGVGSITDAAAASLYMQLGANFIVTPVLREDIAVVCNRRKVLWSSGCGSLTEIAKAEQLGCEIIKLFPGGIHGPDFVKAIKGPHPWTDIMPTGGVSTTRESLELWFSAGITCVGIGSKLISKEILETENFHKLTTEVQRILKIIKKCKKQ